MFAAEAVGGDLDHSVPRGDVCLRSTCHSGFCFFRPSAQLGSTGVRLLPPGNGKMGHVEEGRAPGGGWEWKGCNLGWEEKVG